MKKISATIVAFMLAFPLATQAADPLPRGKPEDVGMSSARLAQIAKYTNGQIADGQIAGAVVAIARRGQLVYFEAFGHRDKAAGTPMTTDAIFSLASMTKPMTAVAALQLHEQSRLPMDEPLATYFPKFADRPVAVLDTAKDAIVDKVPPLRQITIQDLYRHTSGLSYGGSGTTVLHKMYPPSSNGAARTLTGAELLDKLSALPAPYQPGTQWEYSFGLDVLGLVVEKLVGKSLGQSLQETLWGPLGMVDTGFVVPAAKATRYAHALPVDPITGKPQSVPSPMEATKFECGGGCGVGTAGDYLRFAQMLLGNGRIGDTRILSRKTVEYMISNQLAPDVRTSQLRNFYADQSFGLSVAVRTQPGIARTTGSVGEYSWPGAYGTYWWADPSEELAVVWMAATASPAMTLRHRYAIKALVTQAIDE